MSISSLLWQVNLDLARDCLENSFVRGIADGTLDPEKFAYYVGQDAFFLEAFARAYSIAAAKSPDFLAFRTFHTLADGVLSELRLHENYAQTWGVDLTSVEPDTATRCYTDFLLATAWGGDIGLTAAAMSPCMQLYAYLAEELTSSNIPNNPYSDWISTYSSQDFVTLVRQLVTLVNTYTTDSTLARSTYRYAMLCERNFFQSAWTA